MLDYERSKHGGLNMGTIFIITLAFIAGSFITLIVKPKNKVHFYVARDKDYSLNLYLGKPIRASDEFLPCPYGRFIRKVESFPEYGLNMHDFNNLKWEDEPVEVFLNMEE